MFLSLAGYDPRQSARRLSVPLRAINGDLYPTDVEGVRKVKPDFAVVIMDHMGHYPMLARHSEETAYGRSAHIRRRWPTCGD
jgi:hypothetical protein